MKYKGHVNPSSIGSYFGVGFNSPRDQFLIDTGRLTPEFDDAAKDRMNLGKFLEDASLNYFENKLGIKITNRNTELKEFYDGKIVGRVDGETILGGLKTVVENKIANSSGYKFTDSLGYLFQVQCYMVDGDYDQALLCGLYQGKPILRVIARDETIGNDIKVMTDFIVDAQAGFVDFDNDFPKALFEKYASETAPELTDVSDNLKAYWYKMAVLNKAKKENEDAIKALNNDYSAVLDELEYYDKGKYEDDFVKVSFSTTTRKGSFDVDAYMLDHPLEDLSKYYGTGSTYKITRITRKGE